MCEETPLQLNGTRLKSQAKLEKHFRWFYTEYTFTEVFDCVGDTFKIAPTNYADKDVVSFWFTGQPNLIEGLSGAEASEKLSNMEPFVSKWLNDNFYQVCFDYIVNHYDSIPNPPVSREQFIELHDSLANFLLKGQDDILKVNAAETMRSFFNSDAYAQFFNEQTPCGKELNQELAHRLNIFWFNVPYTLSMPGTVVDAGQASAVMASSIMPSPANDSSHTTTSSRPPRASLTSGPISSHCSSSFSPSAVSSIARGIINKIAIFFTRPSNTFSLPF
jgi:hypothetical protein